VGVAVRTAVSPDGRTWQIVKVRERLSFAESKREPFFWSSIVLTVVLVGVIVRLVLVDPTSPMMLAFAVPLAIVWILERGTYLARPRIKAETRDHPPERVVWKADHLLGSARVMLRAAQAIEAGAAVSALRGLRLVQWDGGEKSG
jgi:hypothetical protein